MNAQEKFLLASRLAWRRERATTRRKMDMLSSNDLFIFAMNESEAIELYRALISVTKYPRDSKPDSEEMKNWMVLTNLHQSIRDRYLRSE